MRAFFDKFNKHFLQILREKILPCGLVFQSPENVCLFVQFAAIGVDLTDMEVSDSTVGELTRLYLIRCNNCEQTEKDRLVTRSLVRFDIT